MVRYSYVLFCIFLVLSNLSVSISKRHSYPSSRGGLSGGSHSYPSSGGLSGGGHGYPSSGGSHGYPSSGGLSGGGRGYPPSGGNHGYPSPGGSHGYPPSNTNTGSHGYPSGGRLSGNSPSHTGTTHTTTNIHYNYNYHPPQQIRYTPAHGGPPVSYPVYHGTPPTYVYKYKDSGSKYGTLLAGLALLNLGTLGVSAYALSKSGQSSSNYKPQPGESCIFGVKKDNGDYEETKIDCNLITSFIFQEESKPHNTGTNSTVVTTTVTNVTIVNSTNAGSDQPAAPGNGTKTLYEMLPNGTLVPVNVAAVNTTASSNNTSPDASMTSSVTTITTTNTTVSNALDVKGDPVKVTPGMQCYVIRRTPSSQMKKAVSCGLLQKYADESLKKNSASRNIPVISIFSAVLAILVAY